MTYLDITCPNCGGFHHNSNGRKPVSCPRCQNPQAIILDHSYEIDSRFRQERRGDEDE